MAFKVQCRLLAFMGDTENFPCHFGYKVGDRFTYDGEQFSGRICSGLFGGMSSVLAAVHYGGNKYAERILFRYGGHCRKDPAMEKYDGQGWAPVKETPKNLDTKGLNFQATPQLERQKGWTFVCGDARTSALFLAEPVGLASGGNHTPFYRREMAVLEKIRKEPGMGIDEILKSFTDWERDEIWPPLTSTNVELMLDELQQVDYIELRDGRAYSKK